MGPDQVADRGADQVADDFIPFPNAAAAFLERVFYAATAFLPMRQPRFYQVLVTLVAAWASWAMENWVPYRTKRLVVGSRSIVKGA
jgi:hypothetical protein